jgi:RNAse (barnase) inhibitor barstar
MKAPTDAVARLQSTGAPWIALLSPGQWREVHDVLNEQPDLRSIEVDGARCRTQSSLFNQFSNRLSFPGCFGRNWDAFDECIRDLEWLPARGYVVAVMNADKLLGQDRHDRDTFIDIMRTAGEEWANPRDRSRSGVPFHVLLLLSSAQVTGTGWKLPQLVNSRPDLPGTASVR